MSEREKIMQNLHNELCGDLDAIKVRLKGYPKVSLVVRFPGELEKGLWLTDDTAAEAVRFIEYVEERNQKESNPI